MANDFVEQLNVWSRYNEFKKMGMYESYLILFNGWLTMDCIFIRSAVGKKTYLRDDFLE